MAKTKVDKLTEITEAFASERQAVNSRLANGAQIYIKTYLGRRRIVHIGTAFGGHSYHDDHNRSWAGANDGDWANIMTQASIPREALFKEYA